MQKKFGVLRFIGGFYKVVGIIFMVIAVIGAIGICATSVLGGSLLGSMANQSSGVLAGSSVVAGIVGGVMLIFGGAIAGLGMYATGELIYLFLSIEENTRLTAMK